MNGIEKDARKQNMVEVQAHTSIHHRFWERGSILEAYMLCREGVQVTGGMGITGCAKDKWQTEKEWYWQTLERKVEDGRSSKNESSTSARATHR